MKFHARSFFHILIVVFLLFVFGAASTAVADSGRTLKGDRGKITDTASGNEGSDGKGATPSAEQNPRAYVKEGMFGGIEKGKAILIKQVNYRRTSYQLHDDYKVFYEGAECPLSHIIKGFLVKYVLIDGEVHEIILVEKAS